MPITVSMSENAAGHPHDDQIEAYVFGRFGAPNTPAVMRLENHLITCSQCILEAEAALDFVRTLREAFML